MPLLIDVLIEPSLDSKQVRFVVDALTMIGVASIIINESVVVHPF